MAIAAIIYVKTTTLAIVVFTELSVVLATKLYPVIPSIPD
jgi:hypothetical protein